MATPPGIAARYDTPVPEPGLPGDAVETRETLSIAAAEWQWLGTTPAVTHRHSRGDTGFGHRKEGLMGPSGRAASEPSPGCLRLKRRSFLPGGSAGGTLPPLWLRPGHACNTARPVRSPA